MNHTEIRDRLLSILTEYDIGLSEELFTDLEDLIDEIQSESFNEGVFQESL